MKARIWMLAFGAAGIVAATISTTGVSAASGRPVRRPKAASFLATVKAQVAQYKVGYPPKFAGPTASPGAIPRNVKIWIIPCDESLSGCSTPAHYAEKAAKSLGWSVTVFDGKSSGTTQDQGVLDAVAAKANAILTVSVNPGLIQTGMKAAAAARIPVISVSNGTGTPNPPPANPPKYNDRVDVSVNYLALGKAMADAAIAASNGKGDILVMGDKEFLSVNITQKAIEAQLHKCRTCTLPPIVYFASSTVSSTLGSLTVGYLEKHPSVNYIISPYDPAAAVQVAAIRAAGLASRVKIVSVVAAPQNLALIKAGNVQFADVAEGNDYLGYAAIDQTIRILNKKPLAQPNGENAPFALLEKGNLPRTGQQWNPKWSFTTAYKHLWKKKK